MRHPFDGITPPCPPESPKTDALQGTRRSLLTRICAATVGLVGALMGRDTFAQTQFNRRWRRPTTFALGEEGGASPRPRHRPITPSTRRWGEEGGRATTFALGEEGGRATTYALGEEGGRATTYALGEEGGGATTYALGEEGGGATTYALGEEGGRATTFALGEEG